MALLGRTDTRSSSLTARMSLGLRVTNACVRPDAAATEALAEQTIAGLRLDQYTFM
jgi:hypothetical protein